MRILVIEDNEVLCENVTSHLKKENYDVDFCLDGKSGLEYALTNPYDLILLDRMLPQLDGTLVLQKLRGKQIATPVIMVTALSDIDDRVSGLDSGADDYLTKPFSIKELLARIRALSRRPSAFKPADILIYNDITLDKTQLTVTGPACSCTLSKRECSLLEVFLQNPETVVSRQFIFSKVWGPDSFVEDGNIDNYIRFLRRRLKTINTSQQITTLRGVGYKMEAGNA